MKKAKRKSTIPKLPKLVKLLDSADELVDLLMTLNLDSYDITSGITDATDSVRRQLRTLLGDGWQKLLEPKKAGK